jgi:peptidoglycan/xylan/chitin deacetylase (PgdA/CDA1 family)
MYPVDCHVLMYHHVLPKKVVGSPSPYVVFKEEFVKQMDMLVSMGFTSVHLATLFDEMDNGHLSKAKRVVITFDDASADLFEHAVPELIQRGLTATFFVPSGKLGAPNDWEPYPHLVPSCTVMTDDQVGWLARNGFEIGSHSVGHVNLGRSPVVVCLKELVVSRLQLEQKFQVPIRFLAYPFAGIPADYSRLCREAGYRGACSISSPFPHTFEDPFMIRRVFIHSEDTPLRFRLKMTKWYLRLLSRRETRSTVGDKPSPRRPAVPR